MKKKRHNKLNPQEELFCSHYTALGASTFNRKEASAIAAGYSEKSARNAATGLLRRPEIMERIRELHAENLERNQITVDSVYQNILHDRELARARGDISSAIRCDELLGKSLLLFADRHVITGPQDALQEMDADERRKLCDATQIALKSLSKADPNAVQADIIDAQSQAPRLPEERTDQPPEFPDYA
jgi:phage terminase small subunit